MPTWVRFATAATGGLMLALSFEPLAWWVLAPIGIGLVYVAACSAQRARSALAVGGVAGVCFFALLLAWLWPSVGAAAWVALALAQSGWIASWTLGVYVLRTAPVRPLLAAALWTTVESARGTWPLGGMPWGRLGFAVVDSPWSALLPYLGVTGSGFVLALTGCSLGALWQLRQAGAAVRVVLAACAASIGMVPALVPWTATVDGVATVAIVQGDVPGDGRTLSRFHREVTASHVELTQTLAADVRAGRVPQPDLVVWPENSTAVDPFTDAVARSGIQSAAEAVGVPVLLGAIVDGDTTDTARNQSVVWEPGGLSDQRYTKRHLVPFGEYIPLRPLLGSISPRLEAIGRDMVPGGGTDPLTAGGIPIATALCFDVGYDDVLPDQVGRGGQLAIVQTSNAMFTGTRQLDQQFAMSRARAVETGRTVVVASVNGISGVVDSRGRVVERLPVRQAETSVVEVQLSSRLTPAVRYGAWSRRALTLLGLVGLVVGAGLGLRQESRSPGEDSRARYSL